MDASGETASFPSESLRSVPLFSKLPEAIITRHGQPLQDRRRVAGQQAPGRRRRLEQVLHHRPGAGRGAEQGHSRVRPADRPVERRRILRRDRSRLRQAVGRHRPHEHALRAAHLVPQGPGRGAGRRCPTCSDDFRKAIEEHLELRSTVNRYGERNIDLVSGFAENVEIPETFVDYSANAARVLALGRADRRPRAYARVAISTTVLTISSKNRCG